MTFDIVPMGAVRTTQASLWNPRSRAYYAWKQELFYLARQERFELGPMISVTFTLPMPISWSKKKRLLMDGNPHQQKPDIDNILKSLLDSLCVDDTFVHTVTARKVWGSKGLIEVHNLPDVDNLDIIRQ